MNAMNKVIVPLLLLLPLWAAAAQGPAWRDLAPDEQKVLQPYAGEWEGLSAEQRVTLQKGAQRWAAMSPEQRTEVAERFRVWKQMSPEEQAQVRERYTRFRQLSDDEQERVREGMRWFDGQPASRKQQLRQQWLDHSRGGFRSGAGTGGRR